MKRKRFTEEQIIAGLKEHEAGMKTAQIPAANADVDLPRGQAEIEQHGVPVLRTQCLTVGVELGDAGPLAHGAGVVRQAERHAVAPVVARRQLRCDHTKIGMGEARDEAMVLIRALWKSRTLVGLAILRMAG